MLKKIEVDILFFMLIEAIFLLFFFHENIITTILGIILGILLIILMPNTKKSKTTKIILFIITIFLCPFTLYLIINFISDNILRNYPLFYILIPFLITSGYLGLKKYHTFIKTVEITFYFFFIIKIISFILIIPKMKITNINLLQNTSINYHLVFIALLIFYLYKCLNYLTNYQVKKKKIFIIFLNPILLKLISISVLGNSLFNIYKYPYVSYLKTIRYFDFFERIDGILSFEYLFCFIYFFTFLLLILMPNTKSNRY